MPLKGLLKDGSTLYGHPLTSNQSSMSTSKFVSLVLIVIFTNLYSLFFRRYQLFS